jgi:prepilin-type N-terminal cleavage/methylation domain-containing protein
MTTPTTNQRLQDEKGFSLIETMIAMAILATGLLSLAGVFAMGLNQLATSTPNLIAREKAREAVESVHTARDTRVITWAQIRNVADGGVFVDEPTQLRQPGNDGLVNTGDDGDVEDMLGPGDDNRLGTQDDTRTPMDTYTRQIQITEILDGQGQPNPSLRRLRVIISYRVGSAQRTYTLTTFISSIS